MEEKMERYLAKQQLSGLIQKTEERKRLTNQLAELVGSVADEISDSLEIGTSVNIPELGTVSVVRVRANVGSAKFLSVLDRGIITAVNGPGESFYLYNDFNAEVNIANRQTYLAFANHLGEVIQSFEDVEDTALEELRKRFDKLKKLAQID